MSSTLETAKRCIEHGLFSELRNTVKSLCKICQRFSRRLVEEIAIICKKLNSHSGFLSADQDRAKKCWRMDWIGCPILLVSSKHHPDFLIFFTLLQFPHQVDIKKHKHFPIILLLLSNVKTKCKIF